MIGVLTHHWFKEEKLEEGRRLLDRSGRARSLMPGFGTRQVLCSLGDPTKITTLVTWESPEIYDAWRASPERAEGPPGELELWSRPPEWERLEVVD